MCSLRLQGLGCGQNGAAERSKPAARAPELGLPGYRSKTDGRARSGRPLLLFMFPMAAVALSVGFTRRRISAIDPLQSAVIFGTADRCTLKADIDRPPGVAM